MSRATKKIKVALIDTDDPKGSVLRVAEQMERQRQERERQEEERTAARLARARKRRIYRAIEYLEDAGMAIYVRLDPRFKEKIVEVRAKYTKSGPSGDPWRRSRNYRRYCHRLASINRRINETENGLRRDGPGQHHGLYRLRPEESDASAESAITAE
jgi:hypothetical protein